MKSRYLEILVLENDLAEQRRISGVLEAEGHRVRTDLGQQNQPFDALVLGICSQEQLTKAKVLKQGPLKSEIPIIGLVQKDAPESLLSASKKLCKYLIKRPFQSQLLLETLNKATKVQVDVLVIEDSDTDFDLANYQLLNQSLATMKVGEVQRCSNFGEALITLEERVFDIVILDYSLPDVTGLSGLKLLRDKYPNTPVILLTGMEDEQLALSALRNGAEDYVLKGIDGENLVRSIYYAIERNQAKVLLAQARKEAQAASEAKTSFLANMSHEIRTPLTAILGFSELAFGEKDSKKRNAALFTVSNNANHLLGVINNILDFSKIESGAMNVSDKEFSIFEKFEETLSSFTPRAEMKGLTLGIDYIFPLPETISSDPLYFTQILTNLLGNAIKFTKVGGVKIQVSCDFSTECLAIEVIDTGVGIPSEKLERIFEPFRQADDSTTRQYGGTGLGLVISRKLARALGGDISVESQYKKGSSFKLELRTGSISEKQILESVPKPNIKVETPIQGPTKGLEGHVLIADDMPDNRELISFYLEKVGLEVSMAGNGKEALDLAVENDFDLLILDMQMPFVDGYNCAKILRSKGKTLPIVALTASAMSGALGKCIEAGCNEYLRKPFNKGDLYSLLEKYLPVKDGSLWQQEREAKEFLEETGLDVRLLPVVLKFIRNLPNRRNEIEKAFEQGDWERLSMLAHKLGGADNFGFASLGECARNLEYELRGGASVKGNELYLELLQKAKVVESKKDNFELYIEKHLN